MMRESLAKVLEGDVDIAAHTLLPPIKPKPVEASQNDDEPGRASGRWTPGRRPPMPATARTDPATQRVLASARRILGRPKLAMYLVDMQPPNPDNIPHVVRLLQAVVDVAIRAPDEPNMGALLEAFRDGEFAGDVSRLMTHSDAEMDAVVSDEEAETDLRELRARIEDGRLFPVARAVTMPEQMQGMGILALGARRSALPAGPDPLTEPAPIKNSTFVRPTRRDIDALKKSGPIVQSVEPDPARLDDADDIAFDFNANFAPTSDDTHEAPF